jgi:hypothetical protein
VIDLCCSDDETDSRTIQHHVRQDRTFQPPRPSIPTNTAATTSISTTNTTTTTASITATAPATTHTVICLSDDDDDDGPVSEVRSMTAREKSWAAFQQMRRDEAKQKKKRDYKNDDKIPSVDWQTKKNQVQVPPQSNQTTESQRSQSNSKPIHSSTGSSAATEAEDETSDKYLERTKRLSPLLKTWNMLQDKDKKFKQNSPTESASLLQQVHSEIAKTMFPSLSAAAPPPTTPSPTTKTASKAPWTAKEQGTFDIPIEIDDDDVTLLEEDSTTTSSVSSSCSSRPRKKDPPGALYTMAFGNSEPPFQQEIPPPSPPPIAIATTKTSTRESHISKQQQQQHSEASEKTSSSAATCVVGSAEIPIDIVDDDDDDEIEVLEAESTQSLGRMVREMLSSKTRSSSSISKKRRYKSTHGKELFSNKRARPISPERRFIFQTTASRRPPPPPTTHLNPNTWNYKWTCEDAMREQERMFQASAARMRSQTNARVLPPTTTATTTTTFNTVMTNIHETHPHHWQLQDPYARLGVPVGSSPKVIKQQYRRLALVYHPDKSRLEHTATKFQQVTEAYRSILNT